MSSSLDVYKVSPHNPVNVSLGREPIMIGQGTKERGGDASIETAAKSAGINKNNSPNCILFAQILNQCQIITASFAAPRQS